MDYTKKQENKNVKLRLTARFDEFYLNFLFQIFHASFRLLSGFFQTEAAGLFGRYLKQFGVHRFGEPRVKWLEWLKTRRSKIQQFKFQKEFIVSST